MSIIDTVKAYFADAKVALDADDVWSVQGTPVVKHKALERLAAALHITFAPPTVLRSERDECVMVVTGELKLLGDVVEYAWATGEAVIGQNYIVRGKMQAYPYAMAEKRGKDRVILKLCGLAGVYSEEEADDFRRRSQADEQGTVADRPISKDEERLLCEEVDRKGRDIIKLVKKYKAESISGLTKANFDEAMAIMKDMPVIAMAAE